MCSIILQLSFFFFFNDTATTEIYTLSLHDALPISGVLGRDQLQRADFLLNVPARICGEITEEERAGEWSARSEEHTSELQSRPHLVCRLLLERKTRVSSEDQLYDLSVLGLPGVGDI